MQRLESVLTAVTLVAACSTAAWGGDMKLTFTGGFTVPIGSFNDPTYTPAEVSGYDPGPALSLSLSGPLTDRLDWLVEAGKDLASSSDDLQALCAFNVADCDSASIKRFGAGVRYRFKTNILAKPFAFFTVGSYNQERRVNEFIAGVFPFETSDTNTDVGIGFGGGATWQFGDWWGVSADVAFRGIFGGADRSNTWYFAPSGGLFLKF